MNLMLNILSQQIPELNGDKAPLNLIDDTTGLNEIQPGFAALINSMGSLQEVDQNGDPLIVQSNSDLLSELLNESEETAPNLTLGNITLGVDNNAKLIDPNGIIANSNQLADASIVKPNSDENKLFEILPNQKELNDTTIATQGRSINQPNVNRQLPGFELLENFQPVNAEKVLTSSIPIDGKNSLTAVQPNQLISEQTNLAVEISESANIDPDKSAVAFENGKVPHNLNELSSQLNIKKIKLLENAGKIKTRINNQIANVEKLDLDKPPSEAITKLINKSNTNSSPKPMAGESAKQTIDATGSTVNEPDTMVPNTDKEQILKNVLSDNGSAPMTDLKPVTSQKMINNEISFDNIDRISEPSSSKSEIQTRTVRFHFPENIKTDGNKPGQTIQIKMYPEHLGTVRLTMTAYNSSLIGRLVVDSAEAMHLVESNIGQLIDDLDGQGLKFDSFEISLAGDENNRAFQFNSSRNHSGQKSASDEQMNEKETDRVTRDSRQYVGSTGVNLLA